jgi:hypothetical protein
LFLKTTTEDGDESIDWFSFDDVELVIRIYKGKFSRRPSNE